MTGLQQCMKHGVLMENWCIAGFRREFGRIEHGKFARKTDCLGPWL
jgi:hypothetical protein